VGAFWKLGSSFKFVHLSSQTPGIFEHRLRHFLGELFTGFLDSAARSASCHVDGRPDDYGRQRAGSGLFRGLGCERLREVLHRLPAPHLPYAGLKVVHSMSGDRSAGYGTHDSFRRANSKYRASDRFTGAPQGLYAPEHMVQYCAVLFLWFGCGGSRVDCRRWFFQLRFRPNVVLRWIRIDTVRVGALNARDAAHGSPQMEKCSSTSSSGFWKKLLP